MPAYRFEPNDHAIAPNDDRVRILYRWRIDGAFVYDVEHPNGLKARYAEEELEPVPAPASRSLLAPGDVEEIIDALGSLAGIYADRGLPYEHTARLQRRLIEAQPSLAQALAGLAPAATMTETR